LNGSTERFALSLNYTKYHPELYLFPIDSIYNTIIVVQSHTIIRYIKRPVFSAIRLFSSFDKTLIFIHLHFFKEKKMRGLSFTILSLATIASSTLAAKNYISSRPADLEGQFPRLGACPDPHACIFPPDV
jgi:hypothetical protein